MKEPVGLFCYCVRNYDFTAAAHLEALKNQNKKFIFNPTWVTIFWVLLKTNQKFLRSIVPLKRKIKYLRKMKLFFLQVSSHDRICGFMLV